MKKIIHYCWFGGGTKGDIIKNCIASWKQYCPEFEIREWNESNFDVCCCKYVREAYEHKKWAFVSDYCRFYVLNKYGGIYLDTDVELVKSISDLPSSFVGFENSHFVASGLIRGAEIGDIICKKMLISYEQDSFILDNGKFNLKTVCERESEILLKEGLVLNNTLQKVGNTMVYPSEYFNPIDVDTRELKITANTYSIHHYAASWYGDKELYQNKAKKILSKIMSFQYAAKIAFILATLRYDGIKALIQYQKEKRGKNI